MNQYPVTLFSGTAYSEISVGVAYGEYPWIGSIGFPNDSLSSIKVAPFTKVLLYCDGTFNGCMFSFMGPVEIPDFAALGFGDSMSSMKVQKLEPTLETKVACCNGESTAYSCGQYVPGSSACTNIMVEYCASHLGEPKCQTWCKNNSTICDPYAVNYCDANPGNPFCSCIKSPAYGVSNINPKCVDRACLTTGYLTTAMQNTTCPAQIDCRIQATLNNTGIILSNTIPIQQNCGGGPTPNPQPTPIPSPQHTQVEPTIPDSNSILLILLILLFVLTAITIAWFAYDDTESTKSVDPFIIPTSQST